MTVPGHAPGPFGLNERTRQFRAYGCWVLPGPIQTEAYTRAVLRAAQQRRGLPDDVEAAVAPGNGAE